MTQTRTSFRGRDWWAVLPIAFSLVGLALVVGHVAIAGPGREADEGLAARLWWLLMAAQVMLASFFAVSWLPRASRNALLLLGVQALGILANLAAVRFFDL